MKGSDNPYPSILLEDHVDPAAPTTGFHRLFIDTDEKLKMIDHASLVTDFTPGGGSVATDAIWDAAGDLAVGSGANTAAVLTKGADNTVLTIDPASHAPAWVAPSGAMGAWTAYTPALTGSTTNPTLGSSTLIGQYKMLDATTMALSIHLTITTGGAWNVGSGLWYFSLPSGYAAAAWGTQIVSCVCYDNGTRFYPGVAYVEASGTILIGLHAESGNQGFVGHNQPVATWATNDYIAIGGTLRVAAV
jgi:hypothetical protein